MIRVHPPIDTRTPPPNRLRSFLFKLERHVCPRATVARPYPNQHLPFALFSPHLPWLSTRLRWSCTIAQTLPLMISTSLSKGRAMRCQLSAQKLTNSHHLLCAKCGSGALKVTATKGLPGSALLALVWLTALSNLPLHVQQLGGR